jgi:hypothetical protein
MIRETTTALPKRTFCAKRIEISPSCRSRQTCAACIIPWRILPASDAMHCSSSRCSSK